MNEDMNLVQKPKATSDEIFVEASQEPVLRCGNVEVFKNTLEYCKVSFKMLQSFLCSNKASSSF